MDNENVDVSFVQLFCYMRYNTGKCVLNLSYGHGNESLAAEHPSSSSDAVHIGMMSALICTALLSP